MKYKPAPAHSSPVTEELITKSSYSNRNKLISTKRKASATTSDDFTATASTATAPLSTSVGTVTASVDTSTTSVETATTSVNATETSVKAATTTVNATETIGFETDTTTLDTLNSSAETESNISSAPFATKAADVDTSSIVTTKRYGYGYSNRASDPELLAKANKPKPKGLGRCIPFILLPAIAVTIYSLISQNLSLLDTIIIGIGGSIFVFAFCVALAYIKVENSSYDGVVIGKNQQQKNVDGVIETTYKMTVKTSDGRRITITEDEDCEVLGYNYLDKGDRFFYHSEFNFPYEKYDKTEDGYVYCAVCCAKNELFDDRCEACGAPLLK